MVGQGLLYVKVREGFDCVSGESNDDSDENLLVSSFSWVHSNDNNNEKNLTFGNEDKSV